MLGVWTLNVEALCDWALCLATHKAKLSEADTSARASRGSESLASACVISNTRTLRGDLAKVIRSGSFVVTRFLV